MIANDGPLALSPIVAGAWRMAEWNFDAQQRLRWIEGGVALGITSIDHADIYGDYTVEALFGAALALRPSLREQLQLISKCGIKLVSSQRAAHTRKSYDTSHAHVMASVEESLRALRTDRLDLLLIHRPDALMDADALARTFDTLKADGKVLHVGVSNHSASQLALLHSRHPLAAHQIELSPLHTDALDDGTLDQCQQLGLVPMAWSPLGGGRLFSADDARSLRVRAELQRLADAHRVSLATIAYAWILRHPSAPLPITGSGRIDGLRDAAAALDLTLDVEDWYGVWQASLGREVA
ncbi:MAG: aldo/keto reductase [Luteimonas sp.]